MDVPAVLAPDDVLAQPTRARLFSLLSDLRRPAGTVELAESLNLHPNGVRVHLERMERAGLVERARVRGQRGRPPDAWRVAAGARPGGTAPRGYRDLGLWLARAMRVGSRGPHGAERVGREIGRELAPADPNPTVDALQASLSALGFQPTVTHGEREDVCFALCNCPYRDVVRENQPVVCALHRGITRGLLDAMAPAARLEGFTPHDPDEAGCTIKVRGLRPAPER